MQRLPMMIMITHFHDYFPIISSHGSRKQVIIPRDNRFEDRFALLAEAQNGPLFKKVRGDLVTGLYGQPEVWPRFGYEGSSWEKGGYIDRGFDDIDWLDQV